MIDCHAAPGEQFLQVPIGLIVNLGNRDLLRHDLRDHLQLFHFTGAQSAYRENS